MDKAHSRTPSPKSPKSPKRTSPQKCDSPKSGSPRSGFQLYPDTDGGIVGPTELMFAGVMRELVLHIVSCISETDLICMSKLHVFDHVDYIPKKEMALKLADDLFENPVVSSLNLLSSTEAIYNEHQNDPIFHFQHELSEYIFENVIEAKIATDGWDCIMALFIMTKHLTNVIKSSDHVDGMKKELYKAVVNGVYWGMESKEIWIYQTIGKWSHFEKSFDALNHAIANLKSS